ncbi:MAG: hypothetical protein ABIH86_02370 [Planctomycetota bacterium]
MSSEKIVATEKRIVAAKASLKGIVGNIDPKDRKAKQTDAVRLEKKKVKRAQRKLIKLKQAQGLLPRKKKKKE